MTITQAKLLMLENAYIKKCKDNNEEIYNIENTLYEVLAGKRKLQISEKIANEVVISNFLKYKYIFDDNKSIFVLKERDTLENIILKHSSIKSKQKAQQVSTIILGDLKENDLYEYYTYETTFDLFMYHKLQERTIIEITDLGKEYILNHYKIDLYLQRKPNYSARQIRKHIKTNFNTNDKNKIQEVWRNFKENDLLPIDNKYNEFREILVNMNLITIDKDRNTCATDFALKNKYFLIYEYNSSHNKYQYYISNLGIDFIKNNLKTK